MTITRASIAIAAAGALALGAASPVMATPAQARQIKTLKLELAKADKTIAARNKTIAARNKTIAGDNVTIGALRSVVFLPIPGGAASLATITPAQAWPYVVALFGVFPANPSSPTCGITYQGGVNTSSFNFGGFGWTSTDYDFNQTNNFAPPGDC